MSCPGNPWVLGPGSWCCRVLGVLVILDPPRASSSWALRGGSVSEARLPQCAEQSQGPLGQGGRLTPPVGSRGFVLIYKGIEGEVAIHTVVGGVTGRGESMTVSIPVV